jgi:predicted kinase
MCRAIMLVGLPCSGKSTWRNSSFPGWKIISSDDIIDDLCNRDAITYSEGFQKYIKQAEEVMWARFDNAIARKKDIIIDRTNMTMKSRKNFLDRLKSASYKVDCVVFMVDDDVLQERLENRANMTGKRIPSEIIDSMKKYWQEPMESEGFNLILFMRG